MEKKPVRKAMDLFDKYSSGLLDRREFLRRLAVLAGGAVAAGALLTSLERRQAMADIVPKDDTPASLRKTSSSRAQQARSAQSWQG